MIQKLGVWFPTVRANSGSDVFTIRLQRALDERGIRAEVGWLPLRAEYAPWTVAAPNVPGWANIVHVNSWLHRRFIPCNLPVVATVHSCVHDHALAPYKSRLQALYHRHWVRRLESANLRRAKCVTAVSTYTASITTKLLGRDDIVAIPNGIDTNVFSPNNKKTQNNPFRLIFVGNWSKRKGVDILAPIMQELGNDFELMYTTDRGHEHQRQKLPRNCRAIGRPDGGKEMANWYRQADALLFPTRLEGFGLVAAEAMACGVPVIAANNSALPEVVRHGETGFLCPTDDTRCMVNAIRNLRENPEQWQRLRRRASEWASQEFSQERQVSRYIELYERLTAPTP